MPRMYVISVQSMNMIRAEATDSDDEMMPAVVSGTFVSPLDPTTNTGDPVSIGNTIINLARGLDKALMSAPLSEIRGMTPAEVKEWREEESADKELLDRVKGSKTIDLVGGKSDDEEG